MTKLEQTTLLASTNTPPEKLAGSICWQVREHGACAIRAIGAGAVNQTVKALIIANGFVAVNGKRLDSRPYFLDLEVEDREVTAIEYRVVEVDL